jgi:hypothetical protein
MAGREGRVGVVGTVEECGCRLTNDASRGGRFRCRVVITMTRRNQKDSERRTLDSVLNALGVRPDQEPDQGEAPDFMVRLSGRAVGIEITMYRSDDTVEDGTGRRQVENEWELLKIAADRFRNDNREFHDINVGLTFTASVPPRTQHAEFIAEITSFVRAHVSELSSQSLTFWPANFAAPLMRTFLRTLSLRTGPFAEWHSNLVAGYVARPDRKIAAIVAGKSGKSFRPADELWLAIQCGTRVSEMMLDLTGVADFGSVPSLESYVFTRVFVLAWTGAYEWRRGAGWRQLTGEITESHGSSFDELKTVLGDREWLDDPDAKAMEVATETLREIRREPDASESATRVSRHRPVEWRLDIEHHHPKPRHWFARNVLVDLTLIPVSIFVQGVIEIDDDIGNVLGVLGGGKRHHLPFRFPEIRR